MEKKSIGINILFAEEKLSKSNKPYYRVQHQLGWSTTFDKELYLEFAGNIGATYEATVNENEIITGIVQQISKAPAQPVKEEQPKSTATYITKKTEPASVYPGITHQQITMYTSYAKDIFMVMLKVTPTSDPRKLNEMMNQAVEIVKQAKNLFS